MNHANIHTAIAEAERFLERAKAYITARTKTYNIGDDTYTAAAPRESGALRRASLDLTRALSAMRKPS